MAITGEALGQHLIRTGQVGVSILKATGLLIWPYRRQLNGNCKISLHPYECHFSCNSRGKQFPRVHVCCLWGVRKPAILSRLLRIFSTMECMISFMTWHSLGGKMKSHNNIMWKISSIQCTWSRWRLGFSYSNNVFENLCVGDGRIWQNLDPSNFTTKLSKTWKYKLFFIVVSDNVLWLQRTKFISSRAPLSYRWRFRVKRC